MIIILPCIFHILVYGILAFSKSDATFFINTFKTQKKGEASVKLAKKMVLHGSPKDVYLEVSSPEPHHTYSQVCVYRLQSCSVTLAYSPSSKCHCAQWGLLSTSMYGNVYCVFSPKPTYLEMYVLCRIVLQELFCSKRILSQYQIANCLKNGWHFEGKVQNCTEVV